MTKDKKAAPPESTNTGLNNDLQGELKSIRDRDFLQETVLGFLEFLGHHKVATGGVIAAALVAGVAVIGWDVVTARKEKSAQEALYAIEKAYSTKREKFDQAKYGDPSKLDEMIKAGTAVKATGDLAKDYGSTVDDLEAFAVKHAGSAAGTQAGLLAAETRIQYGQADKAVTALEKTVQATKSSTLIGALVRIANGNALAASGKCDQAVKSWEEVLAAKDLPFLHSEAALRSGLCFEKGGDKNKAIEMYRKASSESDKSSSAQTARTLLRALELGT